MDSIIRKLAARPQRSILVLGLLLLLAGNWIVPLTDRDEARFGEASREMLQRGDYIVPWFNGNWRLDKPVLIYWCQSACYRLLGANEFAARLPSALFTTATALLLVRWGRKIADNETGFIAGAMWVTGLHVAVIGRVATADMAMVFFVTLAVWSGWELTRLQCASRAKWWLIFYGALVLGFLAKGPVAWLPLAGMILGRTLRKDSFRLPWLETVAGLMVAIGLIGCWGIPALEETHGAFWKIGMGEHVIHRSVGVIDSHGMKGWGNFVLLLPLYFVTFLISFLPWTIRQPEEVEPWLQQQRQKGPLWKLLVPVLRVLFCVLHIPIKIWRWWPERRRDDVGWYLLAQALIVFVVFSLVRTKLPHYTMPAFPCLALWLALRLRLEKHSFAWFERRLAAMVVLILTMTLGFMSVAKNHLLTENVWRAVQPHIRADTKVGCFGYTEPSLIWKFRGVTTNLVVLGEAKDAKNFLTNAPPFILVLPTRDAASLGDTNGLHLEVQGLDMVKFKNWDLTAIVR
jgi:4-amino-4-deoxy-L-arabinose transferase-like glycosyltransferase